MSDGAEVVWTLTEWTRDALTIRDEMGRPVIFSRGTGVAIARENVWIRQPHLLKIERWILENALAEASQMLRYKDEEIAAAERKKLYWQRVIKSLTKRLNKLPDEVKDTPPKPATSKKSMQVADNVIDASAQFEKRKAQ
ncbi:hypothetical protein [Capsulimonas corticalis]|nr:hypothetical protein [Capsulimonas corticalis]